MRLSLSGCTTTAPIWTRFRLTRRGLHPTLRARLKLRPHVSGNHPSNIEFRLHQRGLTAWREPSVSKSNAAPGVLGRTRSYVTRFQSLERTTGLGTLAPLTEETVAFAAGLLALRSGAAGGKAESTVRNPWH